MNVAPFKNHEDNIMADFDDGVQDGQKLVSIYATVFVLAVYVLSAGLDVIDLFLVVADPKLVARLACSIQPFALAVC
jgi:hypothetical protein